MTSLGNSPKEMFGALLENRTAVREIEEWRSLVGLNSRLGAPIVPYDISKVPRQARRTMSRMSEMSVLATQQALAQAGLNVAEMDLPRTLMSMGSTTGSPLELEEYFNKIQANQGVQGQSATSFFKVMNHSVPSNVAVAIGFNGAVISPGSACATSTQAAILGWELIQSGLYDIAIVGGADELHYLSAVVFDSVYAASRGYHHAPQSSPRPFDKKRDGLVVAEGASVMILESEKSLMKRGRNPLGEFCGGAYLCESSHMSQSSTPQMMNVMDEALKRSGVSKDEVQYLSAHATGTLQGDAAEAAALRQMFGAQVPTSSLKGHFGHSMAACGVQELVATLMMMDEGVQIGTRNLEEVAPECSGVMHLQKNQKVNFDTALSNNFAFGGINTSFVVKKFTP